MVTSINITGELTAADYNRLTSEVNAAPGDILLHIDSTGGGQGFERVVEALQNHDGNVTASVTGSCFGEAMAIAAQANTITATSSATFAGSGYLNVSNAITAGRRLALGAVSWSTMKAVSGSNKTPLTADEAKANGVVDTVTPPA